MTSMDIRSAEAMAKKAGADKDRAQRDKLMQDAKDKALRTDKTKGPNRLRKPGGHPPPRRGPGDVDMSTSKKAVAEEMRKNPPGGDMPPPPSPRPSGVVSDPPAIPRRGPGDMPTKPTAPTAPTPRTAPTSPREALEKLTGGRPMTPRSPKPPGVAFDPMTGIPPKGKQPDTKPMTTTPGTLPVKTDSPPPTATTPGPRPSFLPTTPKSMMAKGGRVSLSPKAKKSSSVGGVHKFSHGGKIDGCAVRGKTNTKKF